MDKSILRIVEEMLSAPIDDPKSWRQYIDWPTEEKDGEKSEEKSEDKQKEKSDGSEENGG